MILQLTYVILHVGTDTTAYYMILHVGLDTIATYVILHVGLTLDTTAHLCDASCGT